MQEFMDEKRMFTASGCVSIATLALSALGLVPDPVAGSMFIISFAMFGIQLGWIAYDALKGGE